MAIVVLGILVFLFSKIQGKSELPIFGPEDFNQALVHPGIQNKKGPHRVSNFELINQNGEKITEADYESKIYVTDFFFTRCPSICPIMTTNMVRLQEVFHDTEEFMLLSISVTPEMDSVPILKNYALRNGAKDFKWNITTGDKKLIYDLARKSYFAAIDEGDGGLQDFIHTPNFVLVDQNKQIRGVYDGTDHDEILKLIDDVKTLIQ